VHLVAARDGVKGDFPKEVQVRATRCRCGLGFQDRRIRPLCHPSEPI